MLGSCGGPKDRLTGVHSMTCAPATFTIMAGEKQ